MPIFLQYILPATILIAALVDDLKTRKIHNKLVIVCFSVSFVIIAATGGLTGIKISLLASATALIIMLPFVLMKALGAGDMKLMMAFGIASNPNDVFWIIIYSFFWGAILGLFKAIMNKQGVELLKNTVKLASKKIKSQDELHKIPFTVALFFAWLTQLTLHTQFLEVF